MLILAHVKEALGSVLKEIDVTWLFADGPIEGCNGWIIVCLGMIAAAETILYLRSFLYCLTL